MPNQGVPAGIAYVELRLSNTDFITEPIRRQTTRAGEEAEQTLRERLTAGVQSAGQGIGKAMSGIAVAGGAAFAAAFAEALDVQKAQSKLRAQLGLSTKESQRIGKVAGDLFSNAYGDSMEDVNEAIKSVVQNMDGMRTASSAVLKDTAKDALNLATIMDEDVGKVTTAVAQILRTGLAKNAKEAFDVLAVGVQKGANRAEDLLDTFVEYGTQFRKMGLSAKQATGILTQGLQAGARDADIVADAIKEFSIRAIDGSTTTAAGFKALGLNAGEMARAIGKGGDFANEALDMTLDRLRAIDDPVKREAAAVALFGTQAEDLGKALFAIDPSTAVNALGKVEGAANGVDKALNDNAQTTFTAWKRQAQTSIVNVIVAEVLPRLQDLQTALNAMGVNGNNIARATIGVLAFAAAWKTAQLAIAVVTKQVLGMSIASVMATATRNVFMFVAALRNMNLAYAANATLGARLGGAIRGQIVLWQAQAAATNRSTAAVIANAAATKIAAAATRVWAIAVGIFNAVVNANPISLIVIAIIALIAIVVLAYKRFDWFRNFVNAVWAGIQNAITVAWNFIKPVFLQIVHYLVVVIGTALRWYWAYVKFVFTTVWTIISFTWNLIKVIFLAIAGFLQGPLRIGWIILQNTIKIVWIAIQIYIKVAWFAIKGYFNLIKLYITAVLIPIFKFLYSNVVKPVWSAIQVVIKVAWAVIKAQWNAMRAFISNVLAPIFRWLWNNIIKPVWNSIKNHISSVINNGIKPAFNGLKSAVNAVKNAFSTAVNAIKGIWDRLKGIAKTPVNFVIGLYNKGIVDMVNKLASFAGIKTRLGKVPTFARGGVMPGYSPGRDTLMAAVSPGEAILRPEFTRAVGPKMINAWNGIARKYGPSGIRNWFASGGGKLGGEGLKFAKGGVVPRGFAGNFDLGGIVSGFVKGVKNFAFGNVEKVAKSTLDKLLGGNVPGSGLFRDAIAAIPNKLKGWVLQWVKSKIGAFGGKGVNKALAWAKTQAGKPYVWGGVGPGGYDCSGFMSAIANVMDGKSPYSRRFTTFSFNGSSAPKGFRLRQAAGFRVGVTNAGVGHMAGTLNKTNVESSGSRGVHLGSSARGFNDGLFPAWYGYKADTGGALLPGWNPPILNKTGHPEPILNPRQANIVERSLDANVSGQGQTIDNRTYVYPQRADFTIQDLEALERRRDAKARVGRPK